MLNDLLFAIPLVRQNECLLKLQFNFFKVSYFYNFYSACKFFLQTGLYFQEHINVYINIAWNDIICIHLIIYNFISLL